MGPVPDHFPYARVAVTADLIGKLGDRYPDTQKRRPDASAFFVSADASWIRHWHSRRKVYFEVARFTAQLMKIPVRNNPRGGA